MVNVGIQGQIQKLISYLDNDKKIINWPTVLSELKTLAKSSGYTCNDVSVISLIVKLHKAACPNL